MSMAIQPSNHNGAGALALFADDPQERRRMFLNLIQRDINEDQLRLLFGICDRYGFDPMLKHVILIQKGMYVTRDGMRQYAHRTGLYGGCEEIAKSQDSKGKWCVTVAVYRKGCERPFVETAYQVEHENPNSPPWQKSPYRMTKKCAELAALRSAFPVELGGAEEVGYDGGANTNIGQVIEISDGEVVVEDRPAALSAPTPLRPAPPFKVHDWTDERLLAAMGEGRPAPQLRILMETFFGYAGDKENLTKRVLLVRDAGPEKDTDGCVEYRALLQELALARADALGIPRKQPTQPEPPADDLTAVVGEPEGDPKSKLIRLAFETGAMRGWDEARVRKFGAQLYQSDNMERWSISQLDTFVAWLRDEKHNQAAG